MAESQNAEGRKKVAELIKKIKFTMLTTIEADGSLHSRPMTMLDEDFAEELWFFVGSQSGQVAEITADAQVNLSFADPGSSAYVSLSGTATLVRDWQKAEALWKPTYTTWFPAGLDDPHLALLRVRASQAEYWDAPGAKVLQMFSFVKSKVTGAEPPIGDHEKVMLGDAQTLPHSTVATGDTR